VGGRQRPRQPVLAGPDGLRADSQPAARAAGQQRGRMPQRRLTAAGGANRGQLPAGTAVGGGEELLAHDAAAGLRARRHDRVACGDDAVDGLEDAALLLSRISRQRDLGQRQLGRAHILALSLVVALVRGEGAGFRAMAGEQRERQGRHRHEHDDRHSYRRGTAADQAALGGVPPGAGVPGAGVGRFEQEGVVWRGPAGFRKRRQGRAPSDGQPLTGPPIARFIPGILVSLGPGILVSLGPGILLALGGLADGLGGEVIGGGGRGEDGRAEGKLQVPGPGAVRGLRRERARAGVAAGDTGDMGVR
jgi:hypothetical protein